MEAYAAYGAWAAEHLGVRTADGVAVAELPAPVFRGMVATKPIPKGRAIISVPLAATLSLLDLPGSPVAGVVEELGRRGVAMGEDNTLALLLLHERAKGGASKYSRHIAALPTAADIRSPFSYTDEELAAFEGTNLGPYARAMRAQLRADHAALADALGAMGPVASAGLTPAVVTQDALCWALSNIWSRFVSLMVNRRLVKAMVPFLDMLNHAPGAPTRHAFDPASQCVTVTAEAGIPAGSQVCLYYGDLSAYEMVRLYGLALPGAPSAERCLLQMALPNSIPHFGERSGLLAAHCGPPPGGATPAAASAYGRFEVVSGGAGSGGPGGGKAQVLRAEFDLRLGAPHRALLRAMRILNAPAEPPQPARVGGGEAGGKPQPGDRPRVTHFAGLERSLTRAPDGELSPAHEAAVVGTLLSNLRAMLAERRAAVAARGEGAAEADAARVAALAASAAAGEAALDAFFDGLRAAGVVKGPAPPRKGAAAHAAGGSAAGDGSDAEEGPSLRAAGGRAGGKGSGGKGGKGGKAASAGKPALPPAPPADASAPAPPSAPPAAAAAAPTLPAGEYVLALAANLRDVEARVLAYHIGVLEAAEADARRRAGQVDSDDDNA